MEFNFKKKDIKINGEVYEISEPNARMVALLGRFIGINEKKLTAEQIEDMAKVGIEVVTSMGLPKEVADELPIEPLFRIAGAFNKQGK